MRKLHSRVAEVHAQFVFQYVDKLNCPLEQKYQLIDAVANTIRDQAKQDMPK